MRGRSLVSRLVSRNHCVPRGHRSFFVSPRGKAGARGAKRHELSHGRGVASPPRSKPFLVSPRLASAEVQDDDAAFAHVVFVGLGLWGGVVHVERQLQTRSIELLPTLNGFFPPTDLINYERRKHRRVLAFYQACAGNTLEL